jgi:hypothetical protein
MAPKSSTDRHDAEASHPSQSLRPTASKLLAERSGNLPVWVRANTRGPEHFTSLGRSKLYELAGKSLIRSVSIRQPGQVKGTRLFHLQSVLDYVASCEVAPSDTPEETKSVSHN